MKNMVCDRCKMVVENALLQIDIQLVSIEMGMLIFDECLGKDQIRNIGEKLKPIGFELIANNKQRLIEAIKIEVIAMISAADDGVRLNISDYLSNRLGYDFGYLSNLFSSSEGISIEQYVINQKIEKVKELLIDNELSLTEISYRLGYSSLAHLSKQFKQVTGKTASRFRGQKDVSERKSLDKVGII